MNDSIARATLRGHSRLRRWAMAAAATGAGLLMAAGSALPAQAIGFETIGSPGNVTLHGPFISAIEETVVVSYDPYIPVSVRTFGTSGALVERSPATNGAQTIRVSYTLQKYGANGWEWVLDGGLASGVVSGAVTSLEFPAWDATPVAQGAGSYRFVYGVDWYDEYGRFIGFAFLYPNLPGETACFTVTLGCVANAGWVDIG